MGEAMGYVAFILVCGLYADGITSKSRLKTLEERVRELEKENRGA